VRGFGKSFHDAVVSKKRGRVHRDISCVIHRVHIRALLERNADAFDHATFVLDFSAIQHAQPAPIGLRVQTGATIRCASPQKRL